METEERSDIKKKERRKRILERKEMEKERRRKEIQVAANALFLSKPYSQVTMEDIAAEVNLSPTTIYFYFKNKADLFGSLILLTLEELSDGVGKIYNDSSLSAEEKLFRVMTVFYEVYDDKNHKFKKLLDLFYFMSEGITSLEPDRISEIIAVNRQTTRMISSIYEEGAEQGLLVEDKGIVHMDIIWGMVTGIIMWVETKRLHDPSKDFSKTTLQKAFEIYMRGIRKIDN